MINILFYVMNLKKALGPLYGRTLCDIFENEYPVR